MNKRLIAALVVTAVALATSGAMGSQLIYRPINPSFGGDPLNGNWLLSQGTAQAEGGGAPGFTIDFPDFGDVGQDGVTDDDELPDNET